MLLFVTESESDDCSTSDDERRKRRRKGKGKEHYKTSKGKAKRTPKGSAMVTSESQQVLA